MTKDEYLKAYTGRDSRYWVRLIQREIAATFYESEDPNHPYCNPRQWLHRVVDKIADTVDTKQKKYDENMRVGAIAAIVFTAWASRIQHAKLYDPNRPLRMRRSRLKVHRNLVHAILDAAIDETRDADYFPGQEWNPPYGPSARGGDFV